MSPGGIGRPPYSTEEKETRPTDPGGRLITREVGWDMETLGNAISDVHTDGCQGTVVLKGDFEVNLQGHVPCLLQRQVPTS